MQLWEVYLQVLTEAQGHVKLKTICMLAAVLLFLVFFTANIMLAILCV